MKMEKKHILASIKESCYLTEKLAKHICRYVLFINLLMIKKILIHYIFPNGKKDFASGNKNYANDYKVMLIYA